MAINWNDPTVVTRTSKIFAAFSLVLVGVVLWNIISTLWFDWQIVTGKRKWKWPMLIYFVARIAMILHIFAIAINRNALSEVDCMALTFMSKFCDALGTCCSSLILVLRTIAVWHRNKKISAVMYLLFIGQIVMWSQSFRYSKAAWNPKRMLCDVLSTAGRGLLTSIWAYTMFFDLVILILCTYRLSAHRRSTLAGVLLRDGISYFCAAFAANLIQTIFAGLQLNPVMNIMTLPFALVVSVIAATSVFRNVFVAFDSFSSDGTPVSGGSNGPGVRGGTKPSAHILFKDSMATSRGASAVSSSDDPIPLGQFRSAGTITVSKVVNVEVDGQHTTYTADPEKGHVL
ncbi:hypothetical protein CPB83DRAFT_793263 [Crepidotus variabilis]|uniref:Transmembrane protein n=1 Tax=Crepidotus variabilis TaxID=179855 RepID=A0A9P6EEB0_9AGAR|nr:hypothetical protein CPB83DRAFT_793263 [Crepidotus variabilis]